MTIRNIKSNNIEFFVFDCLLWLAKTRFAKNARDGKFGELKEIKNGKVVPKNVGFAFLFHADKMMTVQFDIFYFETQQYTSARLLQGWIQDVECELWG